jgi:Flp pilus assembly pilin Flp
MRDVFRRLVSDQRGVTALEYALIGAFFFLVLIGSLRLYGANMNTMYNSVSNTMVSGMHG